MLARIILTDVGHSNHFLASGRSQPDRYRFDVVKGREHMVHRTITIEELSKEAHDFLSLYGYPDTEVRLEFIPEDRDVKGAEAVMIVEAQKKLATAESRIENMAAEHKNALNLIEQLREQKPTAARMSDADLACLEMHDRLLELLSPFAGEMDTPLDALRKLIDGRTVPVTGEAPAETEQTEDTPKPDAVFNELERRQELGKLTPKKLAKLAKGIDGAEGLTETADLIEAILIHEAGLAAA